MNIKQEIIDAIQIMINAAIKQNCSTIAFGVVQSVEDRNKCTIKINGVDYKIIYYGKSAPITKTKYPVFIPFDKMNLAFIITGESETTDNSKLIFSLTNNIVTSTKTPVEVATFFKTGLPIIGVLIDTENETYESLYRIICNSTEIIFSTVGSNILGDNYNYKQIKGNLSSNIWTYEVI